MTKKSLIKIKVFTGDEVKRISNNIEELSILYAKIYNESWDDENWTQEKAKMMIEDSLKISQQRKPCISILYSKKCIVGFSIIVLANIDSLKFSDFPFNLSGEESLSCIHATQFLGSRIAQFDKLVIFREIIIEKEFRSYRGRHMASIITLPLMKIAHKKKYNTLIYWTNAENEMAKLTLGFNWSPYIIFPKYNRVVFRGTTIESIIYLRGIIKKNRETFRQMALIRETFKGNI